MTQSSTVAAQTQFTTSHVADAADMAWARPWLRAEGLATFAAGAILVAHSGMDRMMGYGLKLPSKFKDTHLGRIAVSTTGAT